MRVTEPAIGWRERIRVLKIEKRRALDENADLHVELARLREVVKTGFAAQERADYQAIEMLKAELARLREALERIAEMRGKDGLLTVQSNVARNALKETV